MFHRQGLRKQMNMETTFGQLQASKQKTNTNQKVYENTSKAQNAKTSPKHEKKRKRGKKKEYKEISKDLILKSPHLIEEYEKKLGYL